MNFFRESLKKYEKILKEAELLSENKALNSQQKLEEIQKLQKRLSQASKFKYNTDGPKNKKQVAENVDYLLLNRLKSAVVEDDFNLQKVLTDYYSGLKNISKISVCIRLDNSGKTLYNKGDTAALPQKKGCDVCRRFASTKTRRWAE